MTQTDTNAYRILDTLPDYVDAIWVDGRLANPEAPVRWGGLVPPPEIDTIITCRFNSIGRGTVRKYFVEMGWLGLLVELHNPPKWWIEQNPTRPLAHVFGPEFKIERTN